MFCRSSIHGKGLSRFWSNVEGYNGPLIVLISASSAESSEVDRSSRGWVIGVLITQGFENRETFFGSSGYLFAISPIFHLFPPSGMLTYMVLLSYFILKLIDLVFLKQERKRTSFIATCILL